MDQLLKSKYRIGKKMAENPFSITYQGWLMGTDKPVVIKIYKRGTLSAPLIKSMKQKVRDFSLISHHGIAKLIDGDYGWQGFYYVREFIDGQTLRELLEKNGKFAPDTASDIVGQVLSALGVVHAKGIVHAALKPSNIMIDTQGLVKLTDFVIESGVREAMPQKAVEILDDAQYAAPEELEGKSLTPAADFYSLGLIFSELVTGQPLLTGTPLQKSAQKLKQNLSLTKEAAAALPRHLVEILGKTLQKDPLQRFATAAEFQESLTAKGLARRTAENEELVRLYESVVTQYGGEDVSREGETPQEIGQLHWGKEKHRSWILTVFLVVAIVLGMLYAFFLGR
jgi:eukaryotic-like serine/threonine-protein kinase